MTAGLACFTMAVSVLHGCVSAGILPSIAGPRIIAPQVYGVLARDFGETSGNVHRLPAASRELPLAAVDNLSASEFCTGQGNSCCLLQLAMIL